MKVNINGREVEATSVQFSMVSEPWAEYMLPDGSTVRIKIVLTRVFKTEEKNQDGTPIYQFQSQTVAVVDEAT